jgi:hypothetical protein
MLHSAAHLLSKSSPIQNPEARDQNVRKRWFLNKLGGVNLNLE